ncbi:MAG: chromophore lyase CpcT/CpeT [Cyanobacteria bacterium P01_A01_bin.105]
MGLTDPTLLKRLSELMAGEFHNLAQARAEPIWYVPLTVWQRPVALFADSVTLFLEQANLTAGQAPYRQRILRLMVLPSGGLRGQYYALDQPSAYQGGGQTPEQLRSLQPESLEKLPHCWVDIQPDVTPKALPEASLEPPIASAFTARPQTRCHFTYQTQAICVELGFDIQQTGEAVTLLSHEKGINSQTGQATWGALMGPFRLVKQRAFELV